MDMSLVSAALAAQAGNTQMQIAATIMKKNADAEKSAVLTLLGEQSPQANLAAGIGEQSRYFGLSALRACKRWQINFFVFLVPVPKTSPILLASCPMRGRFLEAILQRTERELAGPGRPGTVDGWWPVERWEALRLALGARGRLAARGGFTACLKGAGWCPGASHRSIPSRGARGIANLGRIAPREREGVAV